MSKIYSTFSNPGGDLAQLTSEFSDLLNLFNASDVKKKVDFGFALNATVETITSEVLAGQKDIRLFHFSGHSGGSGLDFSGGDFSMEHVTLFFNTISSDQSRIECVFLNGCKSAEIVKQLSGVPVVIGTKTKIQDTAARKFTGDFFRSLLQSDSTYKQAFMDAVAAQNNLDISIVDNTRGEGGSELNQPDVLNDYFMVVNDQNTANRTFPFHKPSTNWTKYILILLAVALAALAYLFRDNLTKSFRGYSCDAIEVVDGKCNIVIADFTSSEIEQFEQWLYENIRQSEYIKRYLHPINIGSFNAVIRNNSIDRDSLPRRCGYDFNLTGSLTKEHDMLRAEFNIFPFASAGGSAKTFTYQVVSLGSLDTLITYVDPESANQFVLFELCASCAEQKDMPTILPVLQELASTYSFDRSSEKSYQRIQERLAEVALTYRDTSLALQSYDAITKTADNDFAFSAYEKKIQLHVLKNDIKGLYQTQSSYLDAVQRKLNFSAPTDDAEKIKARYTKAADMIRLDRANLVLKYRDTELKEYKPTAVNDFKRLDQIKYREKEYGEEIRVLQISNSSVSSTATNMTTGPSTILANPALYSHALPTTKKIEVALVTFNIKADRFKLMVSRLEKAGYIIDKERSKILSSKPREIHSPTILYTNQRSTSDAKKLARDMSGWTEQRFEIQERKINTTWHRAVTDSYEGLYIYWVKS